MFKAFNSSILFLIVAICHCPSYAGPSVGINIGVSGYADNPTSSELIVQSSFNEYLALGVSYLDLGEGKIRFYSPAGAVAVQQLSGFTLFTQATYPFLQSFGVYGKAGIFAWNADYEFGSPNSNPPVMLQDDDSSLDLTVGMGLEWSPSDKFTLNLGYDRYTIHKENTDKLYIGLEFNFGN